MKRSTIIETIIVLYVILLLYTGISKLIDNDIFKEQLSASPVLAHIAKPVAIPFPWIEFFVVLLLLIPRWRYKGLFASMLLMIVFTTYILALLAFRDHLPYSCGGVIELLSWKQHIFFNIVFISIAIVAIVRENNLTRDRKGQWGPTSTQTSARFEGI